MLSKIWAAFFVLAVVGGTLCGRMEAVSQAAAQGAGQAIALVIEIIGLMMLWSGIIEVMTACGLGACIERALRPLLGRLFGSRVAHDRQSMERISANVAANFMGLSNAATPAGLHAAARLYELEGRQGSPDSVLTLIILNTTSVQFIPATVAALRSGLGAQEPFDILPAVWAASACSVAAALIAARVLRVWFRL